MSPFLHVGAANQEEAEEPEETRRPRRKKTTSRAIEKSVSRTEKQPAGENKPSDRHDRTVHRDWARIGRSTGTGLESDRTVYGDWAQIGRSTGTGLESEGEAIHAAQDTDAIHEKGKTIIMIMIIINMPMPVKQNSFTHLRVLLVQSDRGILVKKNPMIFKTLKP
jgi:hypothetical protein